MAALHDLPLTLEITPAVRVHAAGGRWKLYIRRELPI
jgi:hypothetical protein